MPLYGTPQAGSNPTPGLNLTSVIPGDSFTLFDGTESAANGLASVAFNRGYSPNGSNTCTFYCEGIPASCTVDIQSANDDVEADYSTLASITSSTVPPAYTDIGTARYFRAKLSAYSSGAMPVVKVQR